MADACLGFIAWTHAGHRHILSCWTAPRTRDEIGKDPSVESLLSHVNTVSVSFLCSLFSCLDPLIMILLRPSPQCPEPAVWGPRPGALAPAAVLLPRSLLSPRTSTASPRSHLTWQAPSRVPRASALLRGSAHT